jgi:hypothetical protein
MGREEWQRLRKPLHTYINVHINHLSDVFPIQNGLKGDALSSFLFKFASEYEGPRK